MKKFLVSLVLALTAFTFNAKAQGKGFSYHVPGYWGNVELNGGTALCQH